MFFIAIILIRFKTIWLWNAQELLQVFVIRTQSIIITSVSFDATALTGIDLISAQAKDSPNSCDGSIFAIIFYQKGKIKRKE